MNNPSDIVVYKEFLVPPSVGGARRLLPLGPLAAVKSSPHLGSQLCAGSAAPELLSEIYGEGADFEFRCAFKVKVSKENTTS